MSLKWTKEEVDFLAQYIDKYSPQEICELYSEHVGQNRTDEAIKRKLNRMSKSCAPVDILSETLETELNPISGTVDLIDPDLTPKEKTQAWIRQIAELYSDLDLSMTTIQPVDSDKPSLVIVISDAHLGKKTDHYNIDAAVEYLLAIPNELLKIALPDFDEIVVALVGDLVDGEDIYAHQNIVLECPVIVQTTTAARTFWQLLKTLIATFNVPVRVVKVPGNHGRMSKTAHPMSNWDNVVHEMLHMMAAIDKDPLLSIEPNLDNFYTFEVKGKRGLLNHIGVQHIATPSTRVKFAGWIISKDIDFMINGHYHQFQLGTYLGRLTIGNGSICGSDDLSETMARDDPASQACFLVYPDRPITSFHLIQW